jgi:hypothetical protein
MINRFLVTYFALTLLLAGICFSPAETADMAALSRPALLATGDTARIQKAFARARRGEPLTVAAIGGSISAGGGIVVHDVPGRQQSAGMAQVKT